MRMLDEVRERRYSESVLLTVARKVYNALLWNSGAWSAEPLVAIMGDPDCWTSDSHSRNRLRQHSVIPVVGALVFEARIAVLPMVALRG
jgi:hypothetical protein